MRISKRVIILVLWLNSIQSLVDANKGIMKQPRTKKKTLKDGTILYTLDGKYHRVKGPAIIWPDGREFYHLDGVHYTKQLYYAELFNRGLISHTDMFVELI